MRCRRRGRGGGAVAGGSRGGAAVGHGTEQPVTFGGRAAMVIPPGAEAVSDPAPVAGSGPLAVTIAVPSLPAVVSEHPVALQTSWLTPRGAASATPMTSWLLLSGVDVLAPRPVHAVVAVGDSITDGVGTAPDADARWTDALATRLTAAGGDTRMAVLNAGISRNELLADGVGGPPPQARFARDVADALGATDVVLNIGTNDIAAGRDAAAIEAGLVRFADAARAAGKRVFLTTITPSTAGTHGSPRAIATRDAVNTWVRTQGREHAAGVVDFAAAVADPAHPERLAPAADAGDGLHLSAPGYRALAVAVPLTALTGSPCLADDPPPPRARPLTAATSQTGWALRRARGPCEVFGGSAKCPTNGRPARRVRLRNAGRGGGGCACGWARRSRSASDRWRGPRQRPRGRGGRSPSRRPARPATPRVLRQCGAAARYAGRAGAAGRPGRSRSGRSARSGARRCRGEGGQVGVEVAVARERGVHPGVVFGARGRGAVARAGRRHGGQPTAGPAPGAVNPRSAARAPITVHRRGTISRFAAWSGRDRSRLSRPTGDHRPGAAGVSPRARSPRATARRRPRRGRSPARRRQ